MCVSQCGLKRCTTSKKCTIYIISQCHISIILWELISEGTVPRPHPVNWQGERIWCQKSNSFFRAANQIAEQEQALHSYRSKHFINLYSHTNNYKDPMLSQAQGFRLVTSDLSLWEGGYKHNTTLVGHWGHKGCNPHHGKWWEGVWTEPCNWGDPMY